MNANGIKTSEVNANVINGGTVNSAANAIVSLEGMSSKEMEVLLKAIKKEIPKRRRQGKGCKNSKRKPSKRQRLLRKGSALQLLN